jgi:hypothetical protein
VTGSRIKNLKVSYAWQSAAQTGKTIRGKNGNMLVQFGNQKVVVLAMAVTKNKVKSPSLNIVYQKTRNTVNAV